MISPQPQEDLATRTHWQREGDCTIRRKSFLSQNFQEQSDPAQRRVPSSMFDAELTRVTKWIALMLTVQGCAARQFRLWDALPAEYEWVLISDPRHVNYFSNFLVNPISFSTSERGLLFLDR